MVGVWRGILTIYTLSLQRDAELIRSHCELLQNCRVQDGGAWNRSSREEFHAPQWRHRSLCKSSSESKTFPISILLEVHTHAHTHANPRAHTRTLYRELPSFASNESLRSGPPADINKFLPPLPLTLLCTKFFTCIILKLQYPKLPNFKFPRVRRLPKSSSSPTLGPSAIFDCRGMKAASDRSLITRKTFRENKT